MTYKLKPEHYQRLMDTLVLKRAATKEDVTDSVLMFVTTHSIAGQSLAIASGR